MATRSVDLAMYSFTDREIAEELTRKGVHVRVSCDREEFQQEGRSGNVTTTGIPLTAGVQVRVNGARDLMHLKSYAFDGLLLRSDRPIGSPTGLKRQDNDVLYQSSPQAVERFEEEFAELE